MFTFGPSIIGLFLLWLMTGLGLSYFLTRRTMLFRYFVSLSIFFAQLLVVLSSTVLGTYQPGRISAAMLILVHGAGLGLSAIVIWKLGWRRLWRFARYRMTLPLAAVLLSALILQIGPCLDRDQACYISHLNDENLNYSASAQWAAGRAPGDEFMFHWRGTAFHRFGADLLLAFVSRDLSVPAIYAMLPLQAMVKFQYLLSAVLFFHLLFTGSGLRRRWGAFAVVLVLFLSPLEFQNYILAFLSHHVSSAAIAILCATMLLRPTLWLAILQGSILMYLGVVYIEIVPVLAVLMAVYSASYAWYDKKLRPLVYWAGLMATVLGSIALRDPGLISLYIFQPGAGSAGFDMLGNPATAFWPYVAGLLSLREEYIGAVFTSKASLQVFVVLFGLGFLGWGLFQAGILRRHFWIVLVALIVVVAHFDRGALLSGTIKVSSPVYPGPKAFIYFHFLWIGLVVSAAAAEFSSWQRRGLVLGAVAVWLLPVLLTGAQYVIHAQAWPAIWSAGDDLALITKIPTGHQLVIESNRPSEEHLWRQLLVYSGSPAAIAGTAKPVSTAPAAFLLPRFSYSFSPAQELMAKSISVEPCRQVLGKSAGFILCGDPPATLASKVQLNGTLTAWDAEIQPLVFCGQAGSAVFWGLKKVDANNASLIIDEWGAPYVSSPPFPLLPGQAFEFTAQLYRQRGEVAITTPAGAVVTVKLGRASSLGDCIPVVGENPTDAGFLAKRFNGSIQGQLKQ